MIELNYAKSFANHQPSYFTFCCTVLSSFYTSVISSHCVCWLSFFPFLVADNSGRDFEAVLESLSGLLVRIYSVGSARGFRVFHSEINSSKTATRFPATLNLVLMLVLLPVFLGGAGVSLGVSGHFRFQNSRQLTNNIGTAY